MGTDRRNGLTLIEVCGIVDVNKRIVEDLAPSCLAGDGVPRALSTAQFTKTNNAWNVVCVGDETPAEAPFLITRNVDVCSRVNAVSSPKLTKILPFKQERAVWVTRGGACFDSRPQYFTAAKLFPITNETYDVMYP